MSLCALINNNQKCGCGKYHKFNTKLIYEDAIEYLSKVVQSKIIVIKDEKKDNQVDNFLKKIASLGIEYSVRVIQKQKLMDRSFADANLISINFNCDYIFAIGSCSLINFGKYCAMSLNKKLIIVPTSLDDFNFATDRILIVDNGMINSIPGKSPEWLIILSDLKVKSLPILSSISSLYFAIFDIEFVKNVYSIKYCDSLKKDIKRLCQEILFDINNDNNTRISEKVIELSLLLQVAEKEYNFDYSKVVGFEINSKMKSISIEDCCIISALASISLLTKFLENNISELMVHPDISTRLYRYGKLRNINMQELFSNHKKIQKKEAITKYLHKLNYDKEKLYEGGLETYFNIKQCLQKYVKLQHMHGYNIPFTKRYLGSMIGLCIERYNNKTIFQLFRDIGFLDYCLN